MLFLYNWRLYIICLHVIHHSVLRVIGGVLVSSKGQLILCNYEAYWTIFYVESTDSSTLVSSFVILISDKQGTHSQIVATHSVLSWNLVNLCPDLQLAQITPTCSTVA